MNEVGNRFSELVGIDTGTAAAPEVKIGSHSLNNSFNTVTTVSYTFNDVTNNYYVTAKRELSTQTIFICNLLGFGSIAVLLYEALNQVHRVVEAFQHWGLVH